MTDKVQKIREEVEKLHGNPYYMMAVKDVLEILDMQEEPVSEELEEATNAYISNEINYSHSRSDTFKAGAKWQKAKDESIANDLGEYINELSKQFPEVSFAKLSRIAVRVAKWQNNNLWKDAQGDDLPEIDREVVAFQEIFPTDVDVTSLLKIVIAHRPNTNGWEGKSLASGKVEHYTPQTYDKGGWNIPDVKFWLDVGLPKEIEL